MKREFPKRELSPENVMEYFFSRVRQYLHIALCFSPVTQSYSTISQILSIFNELKWINQLSPIRFKIWWMN